MLKTISSLGVILSTSELKATTGGLTGPFIPSICGGTGGRITNYTQAQCNFFGHSWEWGACYICY